MSQQILWCCLQASMKDLQEKFVNYSEAVAQAHNEDSEIDPDIAHQQYERARQTALIRLEEMCSHVLAAQAGHEQAIGIAGEGGVDTGRAAQIEEEYNNILSGLNEARALYQNDTFANPLPDQMEARSAEELAQQSQDLQDRVNSAGEWQQKWGNIAAIQKEIVTQYENNHQQDVQLAQQFQNTDLAGLAALMRDYASGRLATQLEGQKDNLNALTNASLKAQNAFLQAVDFQKEANNAPQYLLKVLENLQTNEVTWINQDLGDTIAQLGNLSSDESSPTPFSKEQLQKWQEQIATEIEKLAEYPENLIVTAKLHEQERLESEKVAKQQELDNLQNIRNSDEKKAQDKITREARGLFAFIAVSEGDDHPSKNAQPVQEILALAAQESERDEIAQTRLEQLQEFCNNPEIAYDETIFQAVRDEIAFLQNTGPGPEAVETLNTSDKAFAKAQERYGKIQDYRKTLSDSEQKPQLLDLATLQEMKNNTVGLSPEQKAASHALHGEISALTKNISQVKSAITREMKRSDEACEKQIARKEQLQALMKNVGEAENPDPALLAVMMRALVTDRQEDFRQAEKLFERATEQNVGDEALSALGQEIREGLAGDVEILSVAKATAAACVATTAQEAEAAKTALAEAGPGFSRHVKDATLLELAERIAQFSGLENNELANMTPEDLKAVLENAVQAETHRQEVVDHLKMNEVMLHAKQDELWRVETKQNAAKLLQETQDDRSNLQERIGQVLESNSLSWQELRQINGMLIDEIRRLEEHRNGLGREYGDLQMVLHQIQTNESNYTLLRDTQPTDMIDKLVETQNTHRDIITSGIAPLEELKTVLQSSAGDLATRLQQEQENLRRLVDENKQETRKDEQLVALAAQLDDGSLSKIPEPQGLEKMLESARKNLAKAENILQEKQQRLDSMESGAFTPDQITHLHNLQSVLQKAPNTENITLENVSQKIQELENVIAQANDPESLQKESEKTQEKLKKLVGEKQGDIDPLPFEQIAVLAKQHDNGRFRNSFQDENGEKAPQDIILTTELLENSIKKLTNQKKSAEGAAIKLESEEKRNNASAAAAKAEKAIERFTGLKEILKEHGGSLTISELEALQSNLENQIDFPKRVANAQAQIGTFTALRDALHDVRQDGVASDIFNDQNVLDVSKLGTHIRHQNAIYGLRNDVKKTEFNLAYDRQELATEERLLAALQQENITPFGRIEAYAEYARTLDQNLQAQISQIAEENLSGTTEYAKAYRDLSSSFKQRLTRQQKESETFSTIVNSLQELSSGENPVISAEALQSDDLQAAIIAIGSARHDQSFVRATDITQQEQMVNGTAFSLEKIENDRRKLDTTLGTLKHEEQALQGYVNDLSALQQEFAQAQQEGRIPAVAYQKLEALAAQHESQMGGHNPAATSKQIKALKRICKEQGQEELHNTLIEWAKRAKADITDIRKVDQRQNQECRNLAGAAWSFSQTDPLGGNFVMLDDMRSEGYVQQIAEKLNAVKTQFERVSGALGQAKSVSADLYLRAESVLTKNNDYETKLNPVRFFGPKGFDENMLGQNYEERAAAVQEMVERRETTKAGNLKKNGQASIDYTFGLPNGVHKLDEDGTFRLAEDLSHIVANTWKKYAAEGANIHKFDPENLPFLVVASVEEVTESPWNLHNANAKARFDLAQQQGVPTYYVPVPEGQPPVENLTAPYIIVDQTRGKPGIAHYNHQTITLQCTLSNLEVNEEGEVAFDENGKMRLGEKNRVYNNGTRILREIREEAARKFSEEFGVDVTPNSYSVRKAELEISPALAHTAEQARNLNPTMLTNIGSTILPNVGKLQKSEYEKAMSGDGQSKETAQVLLVAHLNQMVRHHIHELFRERVEANQIEGLSLDEVESWLNRHDMTKMAENLSLEFLTANPDRAEATIGMAGEDPKQAKKIQTAMEKFMQGLTKEVHGIDSGGPERPEDFLNAIFDTGYRRIEFVRGAFSRYVGSDEQKMVGALSEEALHEKGFIKPGMNVLSGEEFKAQQDRLAHLQTELKDARREKVKAQRAYEEFLYANADTENPFAADAGQTTLQRLGLANTNYETRLRQFEELSNELQGLDRIKEALKSFEKQMPVLIEGEDVSLRWKEDEHGNKIVADIALTNAFQEKIGEKEYAHLEDFIRNLEAGRAEFLLGQKDDKGNVQITSYYTPPSAVDPTRAISNPHSANTDDPKINEALGQEMMDVLINRASYHAYEERQRLSTLGDYYPLIQDVNSILAKQNVDGHWREQIKLRSRDSNDTHMLEMRGGETTLVDMGGGADGKKVAKTRNQNGLHYYHMTHQTISDGRDLYFKMEQSQASLAYWQQEEVIAKNQKKAPAEQLKYAAKIRAYQEVLGIEENLMQPPLPEGMDEEARAQAEKKFEQAVETAKKQIHVEKGAPKMEDFAVGAKLAELTGQEIQSKILAEHAPGVEFLGGDRVQVAKGDDFDEKIDRCRGLRRKNDRTRLLQDHQDNEAFFVEATFAPQEQNRRVISKIVNPDNYPQITDMNEFATFLQDSVMQRENPYDKEATPKSNHQQTMQVMNVSLPPGLTMDDCGKVMEEFIRKEFQGKGPNGETLPPYYAAYTLEEKSETLDIMNNPEDYQKFKIMTQEMGIPIVHEDYASPQRGAKSGKTEMHPSDVPASNYLVLHKDEQGNLRVKHCSIEANIVKSKRTADPNLELDANNKPRLVQSAEKDPRESFFGKEAKAYDLMESFADICERVSNPISAAKMQDTGLRIIRPLSGYDATSYLEYMSGNAIASFSAFGKDIDMEALFAKYNKNDTYKGQTLDTATLENVIDVEKLADLVQESGTAFSANHVIACIAEDKYSLLRQGSFGEEMKPETLLSHIDREKLSAAVQRSQAENRNFTIADLAESMDMEALAQYKLYPVSSAVMMGALADQQYDHHIMNRPHTRVMQQMNLPSFKLPEERNGEPVTDPDALAIEIAQEMAQKIAAPEGAPITRNDIIKHKNKNGVGGTKPVDYNIPAAVTVHKDEDGFYHVVVNTIPRPVQCRDENNKLWELGGSDRLDISTAHYAKHIENICDTTLGAYACEKLSQLQIAKAEEADNRYRIRRIKEAEEKMDPVLAEKIQDFWKTGYVSNTLLDFINNDLKVYGSITEGLTPQEQKKLGALRGLMLSGEEVTGQDKFDLYNLFCHGADYVLKRRPQVTPGQFEVLRHGMTALDHLGKPVNPAEMEEGGLDILLSNLGLENNQELRQQFTSENKEEEMAAFATIRDALIPYIESLSLYNKGGMNPDTVTSLTRYLAEIDVNSQDPTFVPEPERLPENDPIWIMTGDAFKNLLSTTESNQYLHLNNIVKEREAREIAGDLHPAEPRQEVAQDHGGPGGPGM